MCKISPPSIGHALCEKAAAAELTSGVLAATALNPMMYWPPNIAAIATDERATQAQLQRPEAGTGTSSRGRSGPTVVVDMQVSSLASGDIVSRVVAEVIYK